MVRLLSPSLIRFGALLTATVLTAGCGMVPRAHLDECQRLGQTLRSDNARLKDQVLALQDNNRDYAERAVDDVRRIALQDETIGRLQSSVQAYQTERAGWSPLTSSSHPISMVSNCSPTIGRPRPGRGTGRTRMHRAKFLHVDRNPRRQTTMECRVLDRTFAAPALD